MCTLPLIGPCCCLLGCPTLAACVCMVLCPLQSLKESQYFKPFEDQALQFETKLAALDEYCQNLNSIQRRWVYVTVR